MFRDKQIKTRFKIEKHSRGLFLYTIILNKQRRQGKISRKWSILNSRLSSVLYCTLLAWLENWLEKIKFFFHFSSHKSEAEVGGGLSSAPGGKWVIIELLIVPVLFIICLHFDAGKMDYKGPLEGVGPENRDFFGPWNGNERRESHLCPKKSPSLTGSAHQVFLLLPIG
jgi:hypothetical protein